MASDFDDLHDELNDYIEIRKKWKNELRALEKNEAMYGPLAPVGIINQIDVAKQKIQDLDEKIAQIEQELEELRQTILSQNEHAELTSDRSHNSDRFTIVSPRPGSSLMQGMPFKARGTHNLAGDQSVWMFLIDRSDGFYLQNPPAHLLTDGKWVAGNICPGHSLRYLAAILVDADGDEVVSAWVAAGRFERIEEEVIQNLPGYAELARVRIQVS